jgi:trans-2-enoyl-CoA reductase
MSTTTALVFEQFGPPVEVLKVREDWPVPPLNSGELRLRVLASPVNPADINLIEGTYGIRPELPAVGGIEGLAEVIEASPGASGFEWGHKVLLPQQPGAWRGELIAPAHAVTPLPAELQLSLDPLQAAMLSINPPTAWCMLHEFVDLQPGDWVAQNASNSGVGLAVAAIARAKGWRTVNLARSAEALEKVRAAGGDALVLDDDTAPEAIREATGGAPIKLALNAVGGDSALRLAKALAPDGKLVTYGAMGRQPLRLPNGLLIFKNISFHGFWVSKWRKAASPLHWNKIIAELAHLLAAGKLHSPIAGVYPLDRATEALTHAQQGQRGGKVLLRPAGLA